jgi:2-haloacid dehalogenase
VPTAAFDIIGTLFTLDRPRRVLVRLGGPPHAVDLWFAETMRDAFAWSLTGGYRSLKEVLEATLPRALSALGLPAGPAHRGAVLHSMTELDAAEGAQEACAAMRMAGWRLFALTNYSEESTADLLNRAGMLGHFEALLSADRVGKTKPHPEVYEMARRRAGPDGDEGNLWLVAAHAWDVAGAARAALRTAWISRSEGQYLAVYPKPDVIARDPSEAASRMIDLYSSRAS